MAVLTPVELATLRKQAARKANASGVPITWIKGEINGALQAIEDWWESSAVKLDLSAKIDAGTTFNFTNQQKKLLARYWLSQKGEREEGAL